ncbi:YbhB/YbcL family Raf kinase inhibitor-like protein [Aspergillus neoniger CBS 115656]|uniref:PEBP-like protein n=1 Tax=Aspergillus neoniger (strain CBS 115656) TaxID=1448310 RepID=A0A318YVU6_ASPNB|nr:PEBP-like protein [Aspergillus neoniger CBS 115656]PYH38636.1 PEBP-like protein [Aspergillus neoniger CBS 115656]
MRLVSAMAAFTAVATAATADTIPPELASIREPSTVLNVTFAVGSTAVSFTPGKFLNASDTKNAPELHLHDIGLSSSGPYLLLMVDPDWNKTTPPPPRTSNKNMLASYIAPAPKSGTHNYTLLLFDQPSNFSIPSHYKSFMLTNNDTPLNQLNLPLVSFLNQTGLGSPVTANYFHITAASNDTSNSSSTSGSRTTTSSGTNTSTSAATSKTSSGAGHKMPTGSYLAGALALIGTVIASV